jgi:crotonobetainyl-CoA:carnitine CoA-transferase CaiB-like acyl-CoA transferase
MLEEYPDEVDALLKPWFEARTKEEIFGLCREKRVPFSPEYTAEDLAKHPHYQARESFVEIEHPQVGKLKYPATPYRFSKTPSIAEQPSPLLGQHNEEVLCKQLGYSKEELTKLRRAGVI